MNKQIDKPAYDIIYLEHMIQSHSYAFYLMSQNKEYNTYSLIDTYMQYSEFRRKMDQGNYSALNKSAKQILEDIPYSLCNKGKEQEIPDQFLLEWSATIYVRLQWEYGLSSKFISQRLPAEALMRTFNPLHETSYKNACEKLYNKYLVNS